jgi:hypothetical protein
LYFGERASSWLRFVLEEEEGENWAAGRADLKGKMKKKEKMK